MDLLDSVSVYIDNTEERTNEVCSNLGKFVKKNAKKMDGMHKGLRKMTHEYKLQKAICADKHDDTIEDQNKIFDESKEELAKSIHHIKLEENLKKSFAILDDIKKEYYEFHKRN